MHFDCWGCVKTVSSQLDYWTVQEAAFLFPPLTVRQVRAAIVKAGVEPAGRRPPSGRGRPQLVYDAGKLTEILSP